jgi:hypothetical protein
LRVELRFAGVAIGFVCVDECASCFRLIILLLRHRNGLRGIPDLDAKCAPGCRDAEVLVAEATDEVERLVRRLLLRQPQRIGFDLRFDRRTHLRRGAKESVRGHEAIDPLVRPLEVVVLNE